MKINGRITEVEFEPGNYFRIRGMVNPAFNDSRMHGRDAGDGFTMNWFWFDSSMPEEVLDAFKKIIDVVDAELQWRGILPKKWPRVLDNSGDNADIFKFTVKSNSVWRSAKDQAHIISVTAKSDCFTDGEDLEKDISIKLKEEDLNSLFTVLENNL